MGGEDKDLKDEQLFWEGARNKFLDGISDRIRTMSLGTLVLIWGVFTGEHTGAALGLRKNLKMGLLAIALSAVIVLALDLLEYWSGYQASRQRVGETVKPARANYETLRSKAFLLKQLLGILTLIALISVLGFVLIGGVAHAQTGNQISQYYGRWCVGDPMTRKVTLLVISVIDGKTVAGFNDESKCTAPALFTGYLLFRCGEYTIAAAKPGSTLTVSWWRGTWAQGNRTTKTLYPCQH